MEEQSRHLMDHIVGVMYCKNEADVLPITIPAALKLVDSLFIADDGSTDKSWDIIQYFKQHYPKVEYVQQKPNPVDQGQRQDLLNEIRRRYKAENTWVQAIDADMTLHTTDLHALIESNKRENVTVLWAVMNAVRDYWDDVHQFYPNWPEDIRTLMPNFHRIESVTYSYRPMPDLYFTQAWRAWPKGFGKYVTSGSTDRPQPGTPPALLLHYGYRGPTHMLARWNPSRPLIDKQGVDHTSIDTINRTNPYFNGLFNRDPLFVDADPYEAWRKGLA